MIDTPATEAETVARIIRGDPWRWHLLGLARALRLSDGWVAAGFVRNAVWDHLHGRPPSRPGGDAADSRRRPPRERFQFGLSHLVKC